jgi:hypothetical protein
MNEARPHPRGLQQTVQSSGYFRDQAALCLEIARHIDDPQAVANWRARASRHLEKADDAENRLRKAPIH